MSTIDASIDWFNEAIGEERETWIEEDAAVWRLAAQRQIVKRFGATCFVKTHSAMTTWLGHPMFDMGITAGAIYVVRNPLDIVASLAAHNSQPIESTIAKMNEEDCTLPAKYQQVPQLIGGWSQNVASWSSVANPALHVMRYEDMSAQPEDTFRRLVHFLQIDPPNDRFERAIEFTTFDSMKKAEAETGFRDKTRRQDSFFRRGQAGGWKVELTNHQAQLIVDSHRQQMERFDYVPEGM